MSDLIERLNNALTGRYQVERQLGEGGMATVYLVRDVRHGRDVALKVLRPELAAAVGAERFLAEIRTTARLQHPHILPLFDSGEADGCLFYAMPYVAGESLAERLDRERQLPVADAVQIATCVAEALHYAHRHGVVHRDIKPANVLLDDGRAVVSDFGIALALSGGVSRLTETGFSLGTPHYMSPEQATGDTVVGPATDVWALGCVLYEMLVGEPPYTGRTPQAILGKIIQGAPVAATETRRTVPPNVDAAIRRALERLPADRFTTAGAFADALRDPGFRHGDVGVAARAETWRSPWRAAMHTGLGVVLGLVAAGAWLARRPATAPAAVMRFALPTPANADLDTRGVWQDIAISPDGRLIAYVGGTANGSAPPIHVWPTGQLSGSPLRGAEGGANPFFSPDGMWIGFVDRADGRTLKRVPATGGRAETITTLPDSASFMGAAWGADDQIIVGTGGGGGLYRVSLGGGAPERLTTGAHHWPALIEGRGAVLLMIHGRRHQLGMLDLRTREVKALNLEGTSPRYVTTGHVVYAGADGSLWAVPFDVESLEVRGSPVLLMEGIDVKSETESAANFSISATGHIVFAAGSGTATNLVTVARDGTRSVLMPLSAWSAFPRFSPDGSRVAFALSTGDGSGEVDLWVLDVARGAPTRVTLGRDNRFHPLWTADGKRLTHASLWNTMWVLSTSADGSGAADTLFHRGEGGLPTSWSPNGQTLAYEVPPTNTPTGSWDIALLHVGVDRSHTEPFLNTAFAERGAVFSPNGRWIAYVSDKTGQYEVYARPFRGPGGEVTISAGGGQEHRWAPGGREIYYRRGADLMSVSIEERGSELVAGTPRRFFTDPYRREGPGLANYDISPIDGRLVMVEDSDSTDAGASRMYVVLNWFTELLSRSPR